MDCPDCPGCVADNEVGEPIGDQLTYLVGGVLRFFADERTELSITLVKSDFFG